MSGPATAFVDLLVAVALDLLDAKHELNKLDAVAGDGDLGLTVTTGAHALLELAPTLHDLAEPDAIGRCGREIARRAPSTGGTLLAFAFMAAGKAGVDSTAPGVERAAAYLDAAARSLAERGQVDIGDRTMLDALRPAADAVAAGAARGDSWLAAQGAAEAADAGSRSTATMAAKVGRAGWLANRAAGHEDAGAYLVALAFAAAAGYRASIEGRHENGRADYQDWEALFVVLAEPKATPIAEALMPGLEINDRMREIAGSFLRSEAVVTTNADADRLLERAIEALELTTDKTGIVQLVELGRLLAFDASKQEPAAWMWVDVLRRWVRERIAEPGHLELAESILAAVGLEELEPISGLELAPWQARLRNAQQRRIVQALEEQLELMPAPARDDLIAAARKTAADLGVPAEYISI